MEENLHPEGKAHAMLAAPFSSAPWSFTSSLWIYGGEPYCFTPVYYLATTMVYKHEETYSATASLNWSTQETTGKI